MQNQEKEDFELFGIPSRKKGNMSTKSIFGCPSKSMYLQGNLLLHGSTILNIEHIYLWCILNQAFE